MFETIVKKAFSDNEEMMFVAGSLLSLNQIQTAAMMLPLNELPENNISYIHIEKNLKPQLNNFYQNLNSMMLNPDNEELECLSFNEWLICKILSKWCKNNKHSFTLSELIIAIKEKLCLNTENESFFNADSVNELSHRICEVRKFSDKTKKKNKRQIDNKYFSCYSMMLNSVGKENIFFGLQQKKQCFFEE